MKSPSKVVNRGGWLDPTHLCLLPLPRGVDRARGPTPIAHRNPFSGKGHGQLIMQQARGLHIASRAGRASWSVPKALGPGGPGQHAGRGPGCSSLQTHLSGCPHQRTGQANPWETGSICLPRHPPEELQAEAEALCSKQEGHLVQRP